MITRALCAANPCSVLVGHSSLLPGASMGPDRLRGASERCWQEPAGARHIWSTNGAAAMDGSVVAPRPLVGSPAAGRRAPLHAMRWQSQGWPQQDTALTLVSAKPCPARSGLHLALRDGTQQSQEPCSAAEQHLLVPGRKGRCEQLVLRRGAPSCG